MLCEARRVYCCVLRMSCEVVCQTVVFRLNVMLLSDFATGSVQGNKEGRSEQFHKEVSGVGRVSHGDVK